MTPEAVDPALPWPDLAPRWMEWCRPRHIEDTVTSAARVAVVEAADGEREADKAADGKHRADG